MGPCVPSLSPLNAFLLATSAFRGLFFFYG
nr:MAG TPA: hypothetical protein [Caudoviricetes sp.]